MHTPHPRTAVIGGLIFLISAILHLNSVAAIGMTMLLLSIVSSTVFYPRFPDVYADNPNILTALKRLWIKMVQHYTAP